MIFIVSSLPDFRHYRLEEILFGHIFLYADKGNPGVKFLSPVPFPWGRLSWSVFLKERSDGVIFELSEVIGWAENKTFRRDVSLSPLPRYRDTRLLLVTRYNQAPNGFLLYSIHG